MSESSPLQLVDQLLADRRIPEAISALIEAAERQDRDALFQLGFWQIIGDLLPRNLAAARMALGKAAALGHHEAQLMEVALVANGSGGPANWKVAKQRLEAASSSNHQAQRVLRLVRDMALDDDGRSNLAIVSKPLSRDGRISRVSAFLTPAECTHVRNSAADLLAPALVIDPRNGRDIPHPIRTSDSASIGPLREDLAIRAINLRVASLSGLPVDAGEPLTILRYQVGQQFRLHSDILPASKNQRFITVIIYLNDNFTGGETIFPNLGIKVTPSIGDALIFHNLTPSGSLNARSNHAGLPVLEGEKWIATRWIRTKAFNIWNGPEVPIEDGREYRL